MKLPEPTPKLVTLYINKESVIALIQNPVIQGRSKHINTRFHFFHEYVETYKSWLGL